MPVDMIITGILLIVGSLAIGGGLIYFGNDTYKSAEYLFKAHEKKGELDSLDHMNLMVASIPIVLGICSIGFALLILVSMVLMVV